MRGVQGWGPWIGLFRDSQAEHNSDERERIGTAVRAKFTGYQGAEDDERDGARR
ncbi:hypothetical protein NITHO_1190001 [Nitrolancea hollandica Lb]|uniref:Uncharacterized protein n=1 Tax=Nitrolancea hollandica Lb TaxID=1129897 RepID=I4ECR8_9BACT|nr:hypothetical protein NITHO_1190001 [Nitrolancea hollandica Lb]